MNEQLLLRLPHRQFVFTIPKVLRAFFRHDKRLHGEISRLVYGLVRDFTSEAAGKSIRCAAFVRWNPHWHGLFLERKLLNERLAHNMVNWTHSGFSVDASIRIPAGSTETRQALAQYIVRPPVSLQKLLVDEGRAAVVYRAPYSDYFHTDMKVFPAIEFLVEVLQHLPDSRSRLIRTYTGCTPLGLVARLARQARLRAERVVPLPSPPPPRSR